MYCTLQYTESSHLCLNCTVQLYLAHCLIVCLKFYTLAYVYFDILSAFSIYVFVDLFGQGLEKCLEKTFKTLKLKILCF